MSAEQGLVKRTLNDAKVAVVTKEVEIDDEYDMELEENELENAQCETMEDESLPFSPNAKFFTLDPLLLQACELA